VPRLFPRGLLTGAPARRGAAEPDGTASAE